MEFTRDGHDDAPGSADRSGDGSAGEGDDAGRDFRGYLRRAFLAKRAERPDFSLRAFARELDLSPSHLCEILKGGQNLSSARARVIATRLGLDERDARRFAALVDVAGRKPTMVRREAERALREGDADLERRFDARFETLVLAFDHDRQREAFQRLSELCAAFNAEFAGTGEAPIRLRLVPAAR
jgi:uncharacterized protein (TIGR02147 family)